MIRWGRTVAAWVLALGAAACDAGSPPDPDATAVPGLAIYDSEGRPLALPTTDPGVLAFEQVLLKLVNEHRLAKGLAPLKPSARLADVARAHSANMAAGRWFAHESPEGVSPGDRLSLAGVDWDAVGENLAAGESFGTPQAVFDAWLDSPGHRANLESAEYRYGGIGYAADPHPTAEFPHVHYWTLALLKR